MATHDDYLAEIERLKVETEREAQARAKSYDMHGADNPMPLEPTMPEIIAQFGEWAVTPFGVECLVYAYSIQWDSLLDDKINHDFWLSNLSKKDWVHLQDASNAIRHGRQIHHYIQQVEYEE